MESIGVKLARRLGPGIQRVDFSIMARAGDCYASSDFSLSMAVILLCFHHHKTVVRAESRAYPAVTADDRSLRLLVEIDGADRAGRHASAAAEAFFRVQQHAAALAGLQRVGGADLGARRLAARLADNRDETPFQASACAYLDAAFFNGMVSPVDCRACQHARKAPQAFIHFLNPKNPGQTHRLLKIY